MSKLQVHLVGPLRVICELRGDVTPRGRRAQGLVALLALSPAHERARAWLQAKLWSDRSPEQPSASLRQELTSLRRTLGEEHIAADYQRVRFVDVRVDVSEMLDCDPFQDGLSLRNVSPDLLKGIDVNDQEFEDWLRVQRSNWSDIVRAASQRMRENMATTSSKFVQFAGKYSSDDLQGATYLKPAIVPSRLQRQLHERRSANAGHLQLANARGIGTSGPDDPVVRELYREGRSTRRGAACLAMDAPAEHATRVPMESVSGQTERGIEIVLTNGRRMIVNADVDMAALARIITVLEQA